MWRDLHSKGASLSSDDILFYSATFCHVLSTCQCFLTQFFPEALARLCSGFLRRFAFCGCCSGEPFAKGDLDAECDAVARQCSAYCWGAFSKRFCVDAIDACRWMLMFVDACNAWSSLGMAFPPRRKTARRRLSGMNFFVLNWRSLESDPWLQPGRSSAVDCGTDRVFGPKLCVTRSPGNWE